MPCWLPEPARSSVICMILNVPGSAALHMVKVPLLLENVPACDQLRVSGAVVRARIPALEELALAELR